MKVLIAALALASSSAALAHVLPEWRPVDAETGQIRDVHELEALAEAFPDSGSVRLRLLNAQLGKGDAQAVLASLAWLKERGYVFSAGAQAQIPELVGAEHADAARALLIAQPQVVEGSEVIASVPAAAGLVETVLAGAGGTSMLVTSVSGNAVHTSVAGGDWAAIPIDRASDLSGVVAEPAGTMTWVASANLDSSEDPAPLFSGLIGLAKGHEAARYVAAPEGVSLSDLSISGNDTVYASDPMGGGIYVKPPGQGIGQLIAPGTFRSPQGTAVSEDGERLYVSDYRYGLAIVELEYGTVLRLASDVPVTLDGTDGLWLHEGELIAVQNGTSPMRISAFTLSEDGTRIIAARVLEQAHPAWTEPLGGSISDGALVYVATGQWDRYDKGILREGVEAIPTQIRRLPLAPRGD